MKTRGKIKTKIILLCFKMCLTSASSLSLKRRGAIINPKKNSGATCKTSSAPKKPKISPKTT